ncbi:MAG: sigma-54 dependent transcriptional regulator [Acidobacteriota bacterium]|nr:sigma-54 dependent transcriptional regulator [Acidobacteriota bacterium]
MARLLLVDDDPFALETLSGALSRAGHEVDVVSRAAEALAKLESSRYDLLITGYELEDLDALDLLARIQELHPGMPSMIITATASRESAVAAMRAGALDYLAKPFHVDEFVAAVQGALERLRRRATGPQREERAQASLGDEGPGEFEELIGRNPRMQRVYSLIRTVAPAGSTVLITGESGTGKERVAAAIHNRSGRSSGPFVRVNCSAFAEGVLESELFGHEQGAFTGAVKRRAGVFRKAHGGTLFLDEIGDLPVATQVKLLRVIQEREVQPVGGDTAVPVDVRLVAATNRDLSREVKEGRFREDLYFRLNVIPIHLPALRERPDDIPHLAQHFLQAFGKRCGKTVRGFTDRAVSAMERYAWPGNVRELENAIERAVVLATDEVIDIHDLPPEVKGTAGGVEGTFQLNTVRLSEVEEIVIRRVLTRTGWNIKRSAETLGITRATLYSKIRKFGLAAARTTTA